MSFIFNPLCVKTLQKTAIFNLRCLSKTCHYAVLNVKPNATKIEIREAYIKLSKQYHPDSIQNCNSTEDFIRVKQAYDVLGDAKQRRKYNIENHHIIIEDHFSNSKETGEYLHEEFWNEIEPDYSQKNFIFVGLAVCVFFYINSKINKAADKWRRKRFCKRYGKVIELVQKKIPPSEWTNLDNEIIKDYINYQKEIKKKGKS